MNILITGIHGFVGSNLVRALCKNNTIYGLDIVFPNKAGIVHTYSWENLENEILPSIDIIIHLAGKAHDTQSKKISQTYFDINTGLTKKIFDYFLKSNAKKFIFFSSTKAVADIVKGEILTEDAIPSPKGPYGESKMAAENYIRSHYNYDIEVGKKVYILRPSMIHGPGNKGNLNLLYKVVRKGIPWPLGAYKNKRSFTSIDNISFVVSNLITKEIPSGVYHISDDEPLSTNELIKAMCSSVGKKVYIIPVPKRFMRGLAILGGAFRSPLNKERLQKLTENYVVSNTKIKKALGINKMPVSARDGLKYTLKMLK